MGRASWVGGRCTDRFGRGGPDAGPEDAWNPQAVAEEEGATHLWKTLENAEEEYGDQERAHRTAYASLKHSFEKVGDHWEPKDHKGPSDERARTDNRDGVQPRAQRRRCGCRRALEAGLYDRAKRLGVKGRSAMSKQELGEAIARQQD